MEVGFTGSREGPTHEQAQSIRHLLKHLHVTGLHHGDCLGSDEIAHNAAIAHGARVYVHPPENESQRAFCKGNIAFYIALPYIERNHEIVDETEALIGMPNTDHEKIRSGTWATLRYAKKMNKPTYVIWLNGEVTKGWGRHAQKVRL